MKDRSRDEELLCRSKAGDLDAFSELVLANEGWLRGFLRARLRDWSSADDLAQDAFITAFQRLKGFRGDSSFESWLRGIAVNHLRNFIRKKREECVGGSEELQILIGEACDGWEDDVPGGARIEALQECLSQIEGKSRALLEQRYVIGKTVREISKESGRGYSALTMQLHRLREALADCIKLKLQSENT